MYTAETLPVAALSADLRRLMQSLYLRIYEETTPELFQADLEAKHEALLLRHGSELVGFTTLHVCREAELTVVYSGDTVVAPEHWGQQTLAFAFLRRLGQIARQAPAQPLFWLLLTKGHRTYNYLAAFARSFWPGPAQDRSDLRPLADRLAGERFGDAYDPATGLVSWRCPRGQLRPPWCQPTAHEAARPATRFFLQRNPNYARGVELVCLCEVHPDNMHPLTRRVFDAG